MSQPVPRLIFTHLGDRWTGWLDETLIGLFTFFFTDTGQTLVETSAFRGKVFALCWLNDDNLFVSGPDGLVVSKPQEYS